MNDKGADQTAQMRRLVCAFVVRKLSKTGFLATKPICDQIAHIMSVLSVHIAEDYFVCFDA